MREFCLVTQSGAVVNMCMNYTGVVPDVTEFQKSRGYQWVPVEKVPQQRINEYQFYSERP